MQTSTSIADSSAFVRRVYLLAPLFVVLACGALLLDMQAAGFFLNPDTRLRGDVRKLFELSEVFAHAVGVALIGLALLVLMRDHRKQIVRVMVCAYGSGIVVNVVKLCVTRQRPHEYPFDRMVRRYQFPDSVSETFLGWISSDPFDHAIHSFPSGHTATAVGLAIGLTWLFSRGGWMFAFFAILAAMQRVVCGAHFLSDICAATVIGCLFSGACLDRLLLGRWFDRFEQPIENRQT